MIEVELTALPEVKIIKPKRFGDVRGLFCEVYNKQVFVDAGIGDEFVQDNRSLSASRGTIRGLHFQTPPFAQNKLIHVTRGRILDIAVDLRSSSPTFGRHVAVELSAADWFQLFVPAGFAHGYCTLEDQTEVLYKVTAYYAPAHDRGIAWDDPALGIAWPVSADEAILADKDRRQPRLADCHDVFR